MRCHYIKHILWVLVCSFLSLSEFLPPHGLPSFLQSKMTTTRSSVDIAMDLTEISAPRISKLSNIESKDQLIMASNGSLISAGKQRAHQLMASVPHQIDECCNI